MNVNYNPIKLEKKKRLCPRKKKPRYKVLLLLSVYRGLGSYIDQSFNRTSLHLPKEKKRKRTGLMEYSKYLKTILIIHNTN